MARTYETQQDCPIARSLDIVGDRWTLLVMRDLHRKRKRFSELLASLEGISPRLLSDRLQALEASGIVERSMYQEHPPRAEYHLTEKGRALRPVLRAFYEWGEEWEPRTTSSGSDTSPGRTADRPTAR